MKKSIYVLGILLLIISVTTITGCGNKNNKNNKNEDKYVVEIVSDNSDASGLVMKVNRAKVTNDIRDEEAKKITDYLDNRLDKSILEYQDGISDTDIEDNEKEFSFDYGYSLYAETDKYLIFELKTTWQAGGPYPSSSDEYYMFDKNTGEIVYFSDLFTSEQANKEVYDYILKYLDKLYKEHDDSFSEVQSGITESVLEPGKFLYHDEKLIISLPKGLYTTAGYGIIQFEVETDAYCQYLK